MYSPGMVGGGFAMLIVGPLAAGLGMALIGPSGPFESNSDSPTGPVLGLLVPGLLVAGGGMTLIVIGARQEPVEKDRPIQGARIELRGDGLVASLRF